MQPKRRDFRLHLAAASDEEFAQQVAQFAEMLTQINMLELDKYGDQLPCCLGCGEVRYVPPPACKPCRGQSAPSFPCQEVYDLLSVYARRRGTCLDLAPERAARLRVKAIREGKTQWPGADYCYVAIEDQVDGHNRVVPGQFHALVQLADGSTQDPSEELLAKPGQCAGVGCSCGGKH